MSFSSSTGPVPAHTLHDASRAGDGAVENTTEPDDPGFEALYRLHGRRIERYCRRRLAVADVEDAVAEVFAVAWRRREAMPRGDQALYWLYGVAGNVVRNLGRSGRRRFRLTSKVSGQRTLSPEDPGQVVVRLGTIQTVLDVLSTLSPADQEILRLRTWEELDRHQIAAVYGITPAAADMRINRALKRMARAMERAGIAEHYRRKVSRHDR